MSSDSSPDTTSTGSSSTSSTAAELAATIVAVVSIGRAVVRVRAVSAWPRSQRLRPAPMASTTPAATVAVSGSAVPPAVRASSAAAAATATASGAQAMLASVGGGGGWAGSIAIGATRKGTPLYFNRTCVVRVTVAQAMRSSLNVAALQSY